MEATLTQERHNIPWEKLVASRKGLKYTSDIEESVIVKAHTLFREPTTALEVGCEGGRWSQLLSKRGWKLTCTEIDQEFINICQRRIPEATCVLVKPDDTMLPCDDASVDLVLCIEAPQVLDADWFVEESSRVLRKGGLIVGVFWNRSSWRGLIHRAVAPFRNGDDFWYRLPYARWKTRFHNHEFHLVDEVGMCWFPFRRKSNSPLIPVAARLERSLGLSKLARFSPLIVFIAQKD